MSISLQVLSSQSDGNPFLESCYKLHPPTHTPKDVEKDHLEDCLVLVRNSEPIGRIAIYRNPYIQHEGKPTVQLGYFECINDQHAANALLTAALKRAGQMGAAHAIGPMNGSTWNEYRFTTDGDGSPPFFTEHTHPAYYPILWQDAGFEPFQHYMSNRAPVQGDAPDPAFFARHSLTVRPITAESFTQDLETLYPFCSTAFAHNALYSPITLEQFVAKLIVLKPFLSTALTRIVLDEAGKPLSFLLNLPDLLDTSGKTLVLKTAAKHPDCSISGLATELYRSVMADAATLGFESVIHAFMHVDNRSLKGSRRLEGAAFREYSLYLHSC